MPPLETHPHRPLGANAHSSSVHSSHRRSTSDAHQLRNAHANTVCSQSRVRFRPNSNKSEPSSETGSWLVAGGLGGEAHADPWASDAGVSILTACTRDKDPQNQTRTRVHTHTKHQESCGHHSKIRGLNDAPTLAVKIYFAATTWETRESVQGIVLCCFQHLQVTLIISKKQGWD